MWIVKKAKGGRCILVSIEEWSREVFGAGWPCRIVGENRQDKILQQGIVHGLSMAAAESAAVMRAMEIAGGDITRTAKLLGITRATVYEKMKIYRINKSASVSQCDNSNL